MEKRCSIFRIDHFLCFLFFDLNLDVFNNIFNKTLFQKSEKIKPYNIFYYCQKFCVIQKQRKKKKNTFLSSEFENKQNQSK